MVKVPTDGLISLCCNGVREVGLGRKPKNQSKIGVFLAVTIRGSVNAWRIFYVSGNFARKKAGYATV